MKAIFALLLSAAIGGGAYAARQADLRDYTIATCLIKQTASPDLRAEGYRLADIVINRAGIDPFAWKPVEAAVAASLAKHGMLMIHVDAPVAQSTRPAPLASCLLVLDDPSVRAAMTKLASGKKR